MRTAVSWGEEWRPELLSQSDDVDPRPTIRIALPAAVTTDSLQTLTVDLDGFDVSSLARVERDGEGYIITLVPPQVLSAGNHRLRLVEYGADGEIIERGIFNIQVKQPLQRTFGANSTLEGSTRFEDKNVGDLGDSGQGSGSVQLGGRVESEDWSADAEASVLYDSLGLNTRSLEGDANARGKREADLGEYLIRTRSERMSAMIGHHAMDRQSLIMRSFHRRGASFTGHTLDDAVSASLFSYRTEPITGGHHILGIEDSRDRVNGAAISTRPIPGHEHALTLSGLWLKGEGRDQSGVGVSGDDTRSKGEAFSLIAESRLLGDRFRMRGEYADSRYRFDSLNPATRGRDDDAYSALVEVIPWRSDKPESTPGEWVVGAEYQRVGLFFASPANPSLPSDKELIRGYSNLQFGNLSIQGAYAREEDNVEDLAILPTVQTDSGQLALYWTPAAELDEAGHRIVPWYGIPGLSLSYQDIEQGLAASPTDYPFDLDRDYRYAQLNATFQYNKWAWGVGYAIGNEEDRTGAAPERRNELYDLTLSVQPARRFGFTTQYQYNRLEDLDNDLHQDTHLWNNQINLEVVPDRITLSAYTSISLETNSDDTIDARTTSFGGNLSWQVVEARSHRPGVAIWLRGEQVRVEDDINPANDDEQYQVFAGITIGWSPIYARP